MPKEKIYEIKGFGMEDVQGTFYPRFNRSGSILVKESELDDFFVAVGRCVKEVETYDSQSRLHQEPEFSGSLRATFNFIKNQEDLLKKENFMAYFIHEKVSIWADFVWTPGPISLFQLKREEINLVTLPDGRVARIKVKGSRETFGSIAWLEWKNEDLKEDFENSKYTLCFEPEHYYHNRIIARAEMNRKQIPIELSHAFLKFLEGLPITEIESADDIMGIEYFSFDTTPYL